MHRPLLLCLHYGSYLLAKPSGQTLKAVQEVLYSRPGLIWKCFVQALNVAKSFPGLLEGLLRSEDQHRALTALGQCCKQLPPQIHTGSAAQQADSSLKQLSLT